MILKIFSFLSLSVLVFSTFFNFVSSVVIVAKEISSNEKFYEWFKSHTNVVAVFTVISSTEVDALMTLTSKIGGLKVFDAPFSKKSQSMIFWCSLIGFIIEDIPQFTIQVSYSHLKL